MRPQGDSQETLGMYNPTHYYVRVSRAETFIGRSLDSKARAFLQGYNFWRCWMFQVF